jgi:hypothetical protein
MTTLSYIKHSLLGLLAFWTVALASGAYAAEKPTREVALKKTSDIDSALSEYVYGGKAPAQTYRVRKLTHHAKASPARRAVEGRKTKPVPTIVMVNTRTTPSF